MTFPGRDFARRAAMLFLAALLLLGAGCVTSTFRMTDPGPGQRSSEGHPVRKVLHGMNTGIYLFYWIPLWSGNPRRPNRHEYDLFEDQVDWKAMRRMFDEANALLKGDAVEDFSCRESSSGAIGLWIIWKRAVRGQALCVVYPKKASEDDKNGAETAPKPGSGLKKSSDGVKL